MPTTRTIRTAISVTATGLLAAAAGIAFVPQASASSPGFNGRIAYAKDVNHNRDIYTVRADGTSQVRLTTATGIDTMPAYSANGQWIAYIHQTSSSVSRELWIMKADGTSKRKVTTVNTSQSCPPQFSPDGRRIAFTQSISGSRRIWTVATDGTTKRQAFAPATDGAYTNDDCAKWSPVVGAGLAYIRSGHTGSAGSGDPYGQINVNTPSGDRYVVGDWEIRGFDFKPDGSRIVYRTGTYRYAVDVNGWSTDYMGSDAGNGPVWSPDGRYIVEGTGYGLQRLTVGEYNAHPLRSETQTINSVSWQRT